MNSKPPTILCGIVARTFDDNLSRNSCIHKDVLFSDFPCGLVWGAKHTSEHEERDKRELFHEERDKRELFHEEREKRELFDQPRPKDCLLITGDPHKLSGNFSFSLVSTSLAYIAIPKNKRKEQLPEIKK